MQKKKFPEDMLNFGTMVQEHLQREGEKGLNELAEAVEVSPSTIYKYMKYESTPSLDIAFRIAKELGFRLDELSFHDIRGYHPMDDLPKWKREALKNHKSAVELENFIHALSAKDTAVAAIVDYFHLSEGTAPHELLTAILDAYMRCFVYRKREALSPKVEALAQMQLEAIRSLSQLWACTVYEVSQNEDEPQLAECYRVNQKSEDLPDLDLDLMDDEDRDVQQ